MMSSGPVRSGMTGCAIGFAPMVPSGRKELPEAPGLPGLPALCFGLTRQVRPRPNEGRSALSLSEALFEWMLLQTPTSDASSDSMSCSGDPALWLELLELAPLTLELSTAESDGGSLFSCSPVRSSGMLIKDCDGFVCKPPRPGRSWPRRPCCARHFRTIRVRLGPIFPRFKPELKRARSSRVSTELVLATSHNCTSEATCIRIPIMHSFGFSWSPARRKHCAGISFRLLPSLPQACAFPSARCRKRCSVRPRSEPLCVASLKALFRDSKSSALISGTIGWLEGTLQPKTFSSPQAFSTRYSCVSTSSVASNTMRHMRLHHFCQASPMTFWMNMDVTS
mmetsp:Transcript_97064/g.274945  ORF Transcript_97064/g.274945 Transcript_97064/m.274945 type:complete len:338 (-) Transcript_97064:230-1243(-)